MLCKNPPKASKSWYQNQIIGLVYAQAQFKEWKAWKYPVKIIRVKCSIQITKMHFHSSKTSCKMQKRLKSGFFWEVENVWVKKINKETHMYKVAVWMRSADFYFRLFTKTISFFRHCEYGSWIQNRLLLCALLPGFLNNAIQLFTFFHAWQIWITRKCF